MTFCRCVVSGLLIGSMSLVQVVPVLAQIPHRPAVPPPVTTPAPPSRDPVGCAALGENQGSQIPTRGAFTVGLVSGLLLGLIGTGVTYASCKEPAPPTLDRARYDPLCERAYAEAYGQAGQKKLRSATLHGGLLGTAVLAVTVLVVTINSGTKRRL